MLKITFAFFLMLLISGCTTDIATQQINPSEQVDQAVSAVNGFGEAFTNNAIYEVDDSVIVQEILGNSSSESQ